MLDRAGCMACRSMFEAEMSWLNPVLAHHIVRRFLPPERAIENIVDMGVGPGYLVKELSRLTNARLVGVDYNPIMLELAKELLDDHGIPSKKVTLHLDDVHNLSLPDDFADLIISFGCMHHWRDPIMGVAQCMRVLKPQAISQETSSRYEDATEEQVQKDVIGLMERLGEEKVVAFA